MTRNRSYTIECEGPATGGYCWGTNTIGAEIIDLCETRREAEAYARQEGWSLGKSDRCPACRNDHPGRTAEYVAAERAASGPPPGEG